MFSDKSFKFLNQIDAGIAKLIDNQLISKSAFRMGRIYGVNTAKLGEIVKKTGASSGFSEGKVTGLGATINMVTPDKKTIFFKDHLMLIFIATDFLIIFYFEIELNNYFLVIGFYMLKRGCIKINLDISSKRKRIRIKNPLFCKSYIYEIKI